MLSVKSFECRVNKKFDRENLKKTLFSIRMNHCSLIATLNCSFN